MHKIFYTITFAAIALGCFAQQDENAAIRQPVERLFQGMQKRDSSMVRSVFAKNITMATIAKDKSGKTILHQEGSIKDFLEAVAKPHQDVWYEEFWNVKIERDGDFAQLWCDYAFYLGNKFSHCGVDAFHLYKDTEGWKIFHLADTRRKEPCNIPQEIQNKHK